MPLAKPPLLRRPVTRRTFLKGSAAAGLASIAGGGFPAVIRAANPNAADTPLDHVVISMQENRSFDHYFGYAPWIGSFGPPAGYTQPDGSGGSVAPYRFTGPPDPGRPARLGLRPRAVEWRRDGRLLHERRHLGPRLLHGRGAPVLLLAVRDLDALRQLLLLAPRPDLAQPVLPDGRHVRRDHDERRLGLRDLRPPDDPRPPRRGRRELEDLQPRLGQRPVRQHRQRRGLLDELRP